MKNVIKGVVIGIVSAIILLILLSFTFRYYDYDFSILSVLTIIFFPTVGCALGYFFDKPEKMMKAKSFFIITGLMFLIVFFLLLISMINYYYDFYFLPFFTIFVLIPSAVIVGCIGCYIKGKETVLDEQKRRKLDHLLEDKKLELEHLNEIKKLLSDRKSLRVIEVKIRKWKEEGYNVDEIQKMVEDVENE